MAYGNFVDYEPTPSPGAYRFTLANGQKTLLVGPAAEDLKKRIDASQAIGPKLAGVNPVGTNMPRQPPLVTGDWEGSVGNGAPVSKLDAPATGDWQGSVGVIPAGTVPVQGAPGKAAAAAGAPAAPATDANGLQNIGLGLKQDAEGNVYQFRPEVAPSKGGMVERSRTESGGFERNADYEKKMANASLDQRLALEVSKDAADIDTEQQQQAAEEERIRLQNEQAEAIAKAEQINAKTLRLQMQRDEVMKELSSAKVDPKQAEKDVYGGKEGIWGILGMLGSIGTTVKGGRNDMADIIESRINRNVDAQKANIEIKRSNSETLLQELNTRLGDVRLAELTLKDVQRQQAANALQRRALLTKSEHDRAAYLEASAKMQEKIATGAEEYRIRALGNVTKSIQNVPGSAGRKAGWERMAPKDALPLVSGASNIRKDAAAAAAGPGGKPAPVASERTEKIAAFVQGYKAASNIEKMVAGKEGEFDDPTYGVVDSWPGKEKNRLDEESAKLAAGYQAGRGKSDTDAELAEKDAIGNGSFNARRRGAQAGKDKFATGIAGEISTLPPAQQETILNSLDPEVADAVAAKLQRGQ